MWEACYGAVLRACGVAVLRVHGAGSESPAAAHPCELSGSPEVIIIPCVCGFGSNDSGSWPNCLQWRLSAPREQSRMPQRQMKTLPQAFMCMVRSSLTTKRFLWHFVHANGLSPEKWRRR